MRKVKYLATVIIMALAITACSNEKETPTSVAQHWCDLNGKVFKATGEDKLKATAERDNYEKEMMEKYKDDKEFREKVKEQVEACEDASEGRE